MESSSGNFVHALRQLFQFALGVGAEVDVGNQKATKEDTR